MSANEEDLFASTWFLDTLLPLIDEQARLYAERDRLTREFGTYMYEAYKEQNRLD